MAKYFFIAATALLYQLCLALAISGTANSFHAISVLNPCTTEGGGSGQIVYDAMANDSLWNSGNACGKIYCVECTSPECQGRYIFVLIKSICLEDCRATMSISDAGIGAIGGSSSGVININYSVATSTDHPCA